MDASLISQMMAMAEENRRLHRGYRICCARKPNLGIKPRKRLKREKPDALAVPDMPKLTRSMAFMSGRVMAASSGC